MKDLIPATAPVTFQIKYGIMSNSKAIVYAQTEDIYLYEDRKNAFLLSANSTKKPIYAVFSRKGAVHKQLRQLVYNVNNIVGVGVF